MNSGRKSHALLGCRAFSLYLKEKNMKHIAMNPYLPLYEYIPDGEPRIFGGSMAGKLLAMR